jgi:ubiquinone/menaquinone biosynthesis C-methylase UbiE
MTMPTWFLDERSHAGEEHLDPGYVPGYDDKSQTNPAVDLEPLRKLGLNETQTLVDLGTGTGTFALAAAPHCRKVIAVDVSPQMLGLLKEKIDKAGIDNIECVQAGFLSYQHAGEPVDFVYSRHALHHLPDFWKVIALNRIAHILKPGGVLYLRDLVYAFEPAEAEPTVEKWLAGAVDDPAKGWTREELETHVREEFSPFSWLLEPMIERSGFRIQDIQRQGQIYAAYTCVKSP